MRIIFALGASLATMFFSASGAEAKLHVEMLKPIVVAKVDRTTQRMRVSVNGKLVHTWKVSTGKPGHETPRGTFKPYRMHTMWHSRKYDMAPMPHSVFYKGGYAVHATYATGRLGVPASHGCVRLSPANARKFFHLVKKYGRKRTQISVKGAFSWAAYRKRQRVYAAKRARNRQTARVRQQRRYSPGAYAARQRSRAYRPYRRTITRGGYVYTSSPYGRGWRRGY